MSNLDLCVWLFTLPGMIVGAWSIYWARTTASAWRMWCGRCLFLLALIELGVIAVVAACAHSMSLAPMALVSVFLVVAMLWETPAAQWQRE